MNIYKVISEQIFNKIKNKYSNVLIVILFVKDKKKQYKQIVLLKELALSYKDLIFLYINSNDFKPELEPFSIIYNNHIIATIDDDFHILVPEAIDNILTLSK